jgi:molybdopterin converting factor small subunit
MSVTILLPSVLRPATGGQGVIEVEAGTVGEALARLVESHERVKQHLFQDDGTLRGFVNVYVNDRDIRDLERERSPVQPGDEISIVPAMAGGAK